MQKQLPRISRLSATERDAFSGVEIQGEFTVVSDDQPQPEKPLYYQPDGKGGIKFVYPDKPTARSLIL